MRGGCHWRKQAIQRRVEEMARCVGLRVSRVNAKNTSKLAFDGTGEVERNGKKDLCRFPTGKVYHADLNATYNNRGKVLLEGIPQIHSRKGMVVSEGESSFAGIENPTDIGFTD